MRIDAVMLGFGHVGRSLASVIREKKEDLRNSYDADIVIVGVADGKTDGKYRSAFSENGLDPQVLIETKLRTGGVSDYPGAGCKYGPLELLLHSRAKLLLETTPSNLTNGEPGLSHIRTALDSGMNVITSNKGPLVHGFRELRALARLRRCELRYSASVAGALPVIPTAYYSLMGARISSMQGILNGSTNYILTQMEEKNQTFEQALIETQRMGIAESDPRLDVEGYDTAFKLLIAANSIMNADAQISDVRITGVGHVTAEMIQGAKGKGHRLKLVGEAERMRDKVKLDVRLQELTPDNLLYSVRGVSKAIVFDSDLLGRVFLQGGESDPRLTAGAMIRDILNMLYDTKSN